MVVAIVLTLIIMTLGFIVSYNYRTTMLDRTMTQAYFTAVSINERIATWLTDVPSLETGLDPSSENYISMIEPFMFVEKLAEDWPNPVVENYTETELGVNMGVATTTVGFTSDSFDEIAITTTAEYSGSKETVTTLLYLQQISIFNSVNTGFDYTEPGIAAAMADVGNIPDWNAAAQWNRGHSGAVQSTNDPIAGSWWSYFVNVYQDGITDYNMDLLALSNNSLTTAGVPRHDYSYRYMQNANFPNNIGKPEVRFNLNPTRGTFRISQTAASVLDPGGTANPLITTGYPFNRTDLRPSVKGVMLTISGVGGTGVTYNVAHDKVVYYTKDHPGFDTADWPNITLATYYGSGITPPAATSPLAYQNLSLYFTDTSLKTFDINSGIIVTSGTMYTKRNAIIGSQIDDSGQAAGNRTSILNYSRNNHLTFQTYNFIFADPGMGQSMRQSRIQSSGYPSFPARTYMNNGSILVQSNHQLTIGGGVFINAQDNKGIVVESAGALVIEEGANVTGNIYVSSGATLTIAGNATIRGNIFCSGTLNINSNFTLNNLDTNQDNIEMDYVTTMNNNATGIFIYNDTSIGVGALNLGIPNPIISSNAGTPTNRIHTFLPYPDYPSGLFCSHQDPNSPSHLCLEWSSGDYAWAPRIGSTHVVR